MVKEKNIYKDKNTKTWFFRAYLGFDENGKKIQKTRRGFKTQKEAKIAYDRFMITHAFNRPLTEMISNNNKMTFEEFYKTRFVKWYEKQVKSQTYENAQYIFEKKLKYFYHIPLKDITMQDVEDWMFELSKTITKNSRMADSNRTLSNSYINRIRGHLKIVLDRALKEGLIQVNPIDNVSKIPIRNHKVEFWELKEFQKVMSLIPDNKVQFHHRKIVYELLFFTGMRIGELQALTWSNVNFDKNTITIDKTLVYNSKNDWYLSTPKTRNAYRTIGIGKELAEKLKKWQKLQMGIGKFDFVCQLDGTFTPSYSFANWLKSYAKEANVKPIKLHALRHSHVAFLIEQNIQPLIIQERLGHATIQITLGTYGHLYAKSDEKVVRLIDRVQ